MGAFDDLIPQGGAGGKVGFIPGTPKAATPLQVNADNRDGERLDIAKAGASLDREKFEFDKEKSLNPPLPPEKRAQVQAAYDTSIPNLASGIAKLKEQYQKSFKGKGLQSIAESYAPNMMRPENPVFNDTSGALSAYVAGALNLSGQQFNTPAEQQLFIGSILPRSGDTDEQIENKLQWLDDLSSRAKMSAEKQLGIAPVATPTDVAASPPATVGASPPAPPSPPAPGGLSLQSYAGVGSSAPGTVETNTTGDRSFVRPEDEAFAARAQELFDKGGSRADFDALSQQFKYPIYGADLDTALEGRAKGAGARILAPEGGQREATALGAIAATPVGAYFSSAGNAVTGGTLDEIIGGFGGDAQGAQLAKEAGRIANPGASFAGEVTGGVLGSMALGGVASKLAPGANAVLRGALADTTFGAGYGAGENNDGRLSGAAIGALAGGGGSIAGTGIAKGISRTLAPVVDKPVKRLADSGITMTAGQIAGRGGRVGQFVKGIEDRIAGLPVIGEMVNGGRRAGIEQLNRTAVDEALAPIAAKLPDSVNTGHDAVAWGQKALSDAYDAALAPLNAQVDNQLQTGLQQISQSAQALPEAQLSSLRAIVQRDIAPFTKGGSSLNGKQVQAIKRGLDARIASASGKSPADDLLADTLSDIRDEFLTFAERADPDQFAAYRAADDAYANFVTIENAAKGAKSGVFSPEQFRTAVRLSDRSARKRATAAGGSRMQDLSNAASEVLPSSVPDSGTAGRLVLPALALGGGGAGYASDGSHTGVLTGAALATAPYTSVGRKIVQAALIGRPGIAVKAGEALRLPGVLRAGGAVGTGAALNGLGN